MEQLFMNILSLGLKPLYEKNIAFYRLLKEFSNKLPRHQNQARKMTSDEIEKHPLLPESAKFITVLDTSTHKPNVSELEIDLFYNQLNDFDFSFVFFKKYYKQISKNLNRLKPAGAKGNLDLIVLQRILQGDFLHPLKPFDVLVYHLKWKFKLTSPIYIWCKNSRRKPRQLCNETKNIIDE